MTGVMWSKVHVELTKKLAELASLWVFTETQGLLGRFKTL